MKSLTEGFVSQERPPFFSRKDEMDVYGRKRLWHARMIAVRLFSAIDRHHCMLSERRGHNPAGVERANFRLTQGSPPSFAKAFGGRQPWALLRNPFGILALTR